MAEKKPQTFANYTRWDPLYHFFALPVFLLLAIAGMVHFIWRPGLHSGLMFVVAVALAVTVVKIRVYALRVQDRVIRLEERLRLASLLAEPLRSRIPELTMGQLVGLRFASDAELPKLAERRSPKSFRRQTSKRRSRLGVPTIGASKPAQSRPELGSRSISIKPSFDSRRLRVVTAGNHSVRCRK